MLVAFSFRVSPELLSVRFWVFIRGYQGFEEVVMDRDEGDNKVYGERFGQMDDGESLECIRCLSCVFFRWWYAWWVIVRSGNSLGFVWS